MNEEMIIALKSLLKEDVIVHTEYSRKAISYAINHLEEEKHLFDC